MQFPWFETLSAAKTQMRLFFGSEEVIDIGYVIADTLASQLEVTSWPKCKQFYVTNSAFSERDFQ